MATLFISITKDTTIFPARYTQEELNELSGSSSLSLLIETKNNIRREYDSILAQVPDMKKHDYEDFLTYKLLATSRSLPVAVDNEWV